MDNRTWRHVARPLVNAGIFGQDAGLARSPDLVTVGRPAFGRSRYWSVYRPVGRAVVARHLVAVVALLAWIQIAVAACRGRARARQQRRVQRRDGRSIWTSALSPPPSSLEPAAVPSMFPSSVAVPPAVMKTVPPLPESPPPLTLISCRTITLPDAVKSSSPPSNSPPDRSTVCTMSILPPPPGR